MPPSKKTNNPDKDSSKPHRPPSRSSSRLALKMQKNETKTRLNHDNIPTNRPGSTGRSFKDVVLASPKTPTKPSSAEGTVRLKLANRSRSPTIRSANARLSSDQHIKDDNQEGKWITVKNSHKSNPGSTTVELGTSDSNKTDERQQSPMKMDDARSTTTTSSTRQEIAVVKMDVNEVRMDVNEVRMDITDIKNDIKGLMGFLQDKLTVQQPVEVEDNDSIDVESTGVKKDSTNDTDRNEDGNDEYEYDDCIETSSSIQRRLMVKCTTLPSGRPIKTERLEDQNEIEEKLVAQEDNYLETDGHLNNAQKQLENMKRNMGHDTYTEECYEAIPMERSAPPKNIPVGYYGEHDRDFIEQHRLRQAHKEGDNFANRYRKRQHHAKRQVHMKREPTKEKSLDRMDEDTKNPLFGQNEFSLKCSNNNKIKYSDMVSYLKDKTLENDNTFQIEKLYNSISGGIMFALQSQIAFMPSFRMLSKEISFKDILLDGLFGTAYDRSKAVFDRFGEIIKEHLTSTSTCSMDKSPKAYRVIQTVQILDGWTILEKLLRKRVVLCGAKPDVDLDIILTNLTLREQESIHSFFMRTQDLTNQYKLQYRNEIYIPKLRILTRFIQELMRAPEYIPYLANQYRTIMNLSKEEDQREKYLADDLIPYTVEMIYDILDELNVSDVPSKLLKSTIELHNEAVSKINSRESDASNSSESLRAIVALYESTPELTPVISQFESVPTSSDCITPSICAFKKARKRCHACLIGLHDEVNCYLRGQAFMPEELRQRINRYNATHGSAPPSDHKHPPYKPSSVNAELPKGNNRSNSMSTTKSQTKKKSRPLPFSNNKTKQPSVNWMESSAEETDQFHVDDDNALDAMDDKAATISAFVAGQVRDIEEHGDFYLDSSENNDPVICVVESSLAKCTSSKSSMNQDLRNNADYNTPEDLLEVVSSFHRRNKNEPNQHFLRQHAHKLSRLPHDIYRQHTYTEFQVDSGANVGAVNDRSLFYFFIPATISVEQAGGEFFQSAGWGGILVELDGRVRLHAPVHYTPNAPRNIFSPGAMITFSGFKESNHKLHQSLDMIDNLGKTSVTMVNKKNGLNFAHFKIMAFDHHYYDMTKSVPRLAPESVYRRPQINSKQSMVSHMKKNDNKFQEKRVPVKNDNSTPETIVLMNGRKKLKTRLSMPKLPHSALSHIASMYINLFPATSPRSMAITTMNTLLGNVYKILPSTIPQIFNDQPIISTTQTSDVVKHPIISSKLTRLSSRSISKFQEYIHLHIGSMHASDSTLMPMLKDSLLRDLPTIHKHIGTFNCTCIFCTLTKATKLPRGHLTDHTRMKPFQQLHMDYSIYNHISLRGMTSALGVVCASTSYPFGFPTKNRNPPLDTVKYLVKTLRSMGFEVNVIRVDEDGALAKSAEFCRLIIQLNCVLQTTSGGNSENNGKVERPHRTQANMVRAALSTMKTIIGEEVLKKNNMDIRDFWCFAYSHAVHVQRRLYSRAIKDIPYFIVHKKRPSVRELVPFGSIVTIVNPSKDKLPKLSEGRAMRCYFIGFGNHVRSLLYWNPTHPRTYRRSYHAIIEDTATLSKIQDQFTTTVTFDDHNPSADIDVIRDLHFVDQAFDAKDIKSISIELPPKGVKVGLCLRDDEIFNIPYLWKVDKNSAGALTIPKNCQRNHFIIDVNGNSPITSNFVKEHISHLQEIGEKVLRLDLVHRGIGDSSTTLEISRAIFDQLPCLHQNRPIISSMNTHIPSTYLHFIRSPTKPDKPKFFHECLKSPLRKHWIAAAKVAFEKNQRIAVFSLPFPKSDLPPDERVFGTTLVPEVKQTDVPGVWELRIRECTIGTKQEKSIDFEESYSPTVNDTTVKIQIAFCAALGYTISIIDVKNAFQNTISKKDKRIFVSVPPTYLEWLAEFEHDFTYSKDIIYVRQMLNANQGTRDAGNQWYILLMTVLIEYGLVRSTVDHGFFVKDFGELGKLYVSLATDDLLCGYLKLSVFHDFVTYLRRFFTIVVQCGNVLKFLGARIIQSDHAITMDHAQYIYNICDSYFGPEFRQIRTVSIPMRTDGELERELYESPPLSDKELIEFALKFKGGFRSHIGKLNFPISTRFDIQFAVQRLSEFSCAPTEAAFNGIDRIYRYLANDILRPLVFPRESLYGSSSISITLDPDNSDTLSFDHLPTLFTDAELGRELSSRRSYYCVVVTLLGVIILCKIRKSSTIMLHTTDSEAQASYDGVRRLLPIRSLCQFMGYPITDPSQHFVDNAAVHQIITSQRMTPRCRHFDIPIAFLHEKYNDTYKSILIKTWKQLGDIGTKPLVRATHKKFKYIGSGERFLPPRNSQHYLDLEMEYYEMKLSDIKSLLQANDE